MTLEEILSNIALTVPLLLFKPFALIFLIFHLLFSLVLVRQTKLMTSVIEAKATPAIYTISVIHLLSSAAVFIWAIVFL